MAKGKKDPKNETSKKESRKSIKGNSPESEEARLTRERDMIDNLNRQNIHKYFKGLEPQSAHNDLAVHATHDSLKKVAVEVQRRDLTLREDPLAVPETVQAEVRLDYDEKKQLENKAYREQIQRKYDYLYDQIRPQGKEDEKERKLKVEVKEILTKEEHERRMQNILAEKAELKKRMEEHQEEQSKKSKEEEQQKESMRKMEEERVKEQRRAAIEEKMKRRKEKHDKLLQQEKELQKKFGSEKKKSRLYMQMEEKYKSQLLLPLLEEKKLKLKQLREFHKRYDLAAVKEHEKEYNKNSLQKSRKASPQKAQTARVSQSLKGDGSRVEITGGYQPPAHSARMAQILQEEKEEIERQVNAKKNRNDQKIRRESEFIREVKEKFMPRIDEEKRMQIERRRIAEARKSDKVNIDQRRLGQNYLQIAKRMRRSQSVHSQPKQHRQLALNSDPSQSRQVPINPLTYHSSEFYEQMRRKKLDSILNSEEGVTQKYAQMKHEVEKLSQKMKQKEELARYNRDGQSQQQAAELLLSSIRAKMGIMSLLKKNTTDDNSDSD